MDKNSTSILLTLVCILKKGFQVIFCCTTELHLHQCPFATLHLPHHETDHARASENTMLWQAHSQGSHTTSPDERTTLSILPLGKGRKQTRSGLTREDKSCKDLLSLQTGRLPLGRGDQIFIKTLAR